MVGESGWGNRPEGVPSWPEKFQDLASYCHQNQDELNTPQISQDEFNFSIDGQGRDCIWEIASPGEIARDPWEASTEIPQLTPDEENNMEQPLFCSLLSVPNQQEDDQNSKWEHTSLLGENFGGTIKGEFIDSWREREFPIKSKGNLLLSQGVLCTEQQQQQKNNLNSILKSEELFITGRESFGRTAKLNSSSIFNNKNYSPHFTSVTNTTTTASLVFTTSLANTVKTEKPESTIPEVKNERSAYMEEEVSNFKVPQMTEIESKNNMGNHLCDESIPVIKMEKNARPKLKLNINAATSVPAISIASLDTPDVISLTDGSSGFDILKFVNEEFDEPLFAVDPMSGLDAVKSDHDYTGIITSVEVLSHAKVKTEPVDLETEEEKRTELEEEDERMRGTKRRRSTSMMSQEDDEDYDEDDDDTYDSPHDPSEDDSQEWSPYKKKTVTSTRNSSKKKGYGGGNKSSGGRSGKKQRKISVDSEGGVVQERYRELRNRNNEASRKSRLNRKQKEMQMVELAEKLEKENKEMKQRAENLDRLVKKLRDVLMNIVTNK